MPCSIPVSLYSWYAHVHKANYYALSYPCIPVWLVCPCSQSQLLSLVLSLYPCMVGMPMFTEPIIQITSKVKTTTIPCNQVDAYNHASSVTRSASANRFGEEVLVSILSPNHVISKDVNSCTCCCFVQCATFILCVRVNAFVQNRHNSLL